MWRVLLLVAGAGAYDWVRGPTDSPDPCPGLYCGRIDRGPGQNVTEVRGDWDLKYKLNIFISLAKIGVTKILIPRTGSATPGAGRVPAAGV